MLLLHSYNVPVINKALSTGPLYLLNSNQPNTNLCRLPKFVQYRQISESRIHYPSNAPVKA